MQIFTSACNICGDFEAFASEVKGWPENCSFHCRKAVAGKGFSLHPEQISNTQKAEEKVSGLQTVFIEHSS